MTRVGEVFYGLKNAGVPQAVGIGRQQTLVLRQRGLCPGRVGCSPCGEPAETAHGGSGR